MPANGFKQLRRAAKHISPVAIATTTISTPILMTPAYAQRLLDGNKRNRRIRPWKVEEYAQDMTAGRWKLNGEAIGLYENGDIANGQHRLLACVKSRANFLTFFVTGLTEDVKLTFDRGLLRTAADDLHFDGVEYSKEIAPVISALYTIAGAGRKPNRDETNAIHEAHPDIIDSVRFVGQSAANIMPRSSLAAIHYIGSKFQNLPSEANDFVEVFKTGHASYAGCPAHALRERIIKAQATKATIHADRKRDGLIHAWNLYMKQKSISKFYLPEKDKKPEIVGWDKAALFKSNKTSISP